jgi:hypothetical protein
LSLDKLRIILLSDFYGDLLTEKQQELLRLHYEDDWSYGEIAERFGISRQAAHDSIKSSEMALEKYEEKLGLLADFERRQTLLADILEQLQVLETDLDRTERIRAIASIRKRINGLMN